MPDDFERSTYPADSHSDPQFISGISSIDNPLLGQSVKRRRTRWTRWIPGAIAGLLGMTVFIVGFVVPFPYVLEMPGPTYNILGELEGTSFIEVEGETISEGDSGQLRMVTVVTYGGPRSTVTGFRLLRAYFDPHSEIVPEEDVYPPEITAEQVEEISKAQMDSSQNLAQVAAFEELGYKVPAIVTVSGVTEDSPSYQKLAEGDVLKAITIPNGPRESIDTASAIFRILSEVAPQTLVKVDFERDGKTDSVEISTRAANHGSGSQLGIYINPEVDLDIDVTINLSGIGGPSAGVIFALAIIDRLTEGDLTGGQTIAGTGAITYDGRIQPIGGVPQKMYGAQRDGAKWFLIPAENCADAQGKVPDGIQEVKISTLHEARLAVEAIAAGRGAELTSCSG